MTSSVSWGSQSLTWFLAFSPARTSRQAICRAPRYARWTAPSAIHVLRAEDRDGRLVALFASDWVRRYAEEKNPGISFKPME